MEMIRKVYLSYLGIPNEYSSDEDVPDRTIEVPDRNVIVKFREDYYGYLFYDVWETSVELEGRILTLRSVAINHSEVRFYGLRIWTAGQLLKKWRDEGQPRHHLRQVVHGWRMNHFRKFIEPLESYGRRFIEMRMQVDESNFTAVTADDIADEDESSS